MDTFRCGFVRNNHHSVTILVNVVETGEEYCTSRKENKQDHDRMNKSVTHWFSELHIRNLTPSIFQCQITHVLRLLPSHANNPQWSINESWSKEVSECRAVALTNARVGGSVGSGCLRFLVGYLPGTCFEINPNDRHFKNPLLRKSCALHSRNSVNNIMKGRRQTCSDLHFSLGKVAKPTSNTEGEQNIRTHVHRRLRRRVNTVPRKSSTI